MKKSGKLYATGILVGSVLLATGLVLVSNLWIKVPLIVVGAAVWVGSAVAARTKKEEGK